MKNGSTLGLKEHNEQTAQWAPWLQCAGFSKQFLQYCLYFPDNSVIRLGHKWEMFLGLDKLVNHTQLDVLIWILKLESL